MFDLASDTGSGARSQIMLHRDPFTNLGFDQVFEPGSYRVRVNLKLRLRRFGSGSAFDGLFEVPTLYKIDGVSLRKVGSTEAEIRKAVSADSADRARNL